MLAVIEIGGNQFIVRKGDVIDVKRQQVLEINSVNTTPVLLISDAEGENVKVGTPLVNGAKVEFKVLEHFKDEKVRVFKMKSKKRYMRNRGFRASMTKIEILSIA